MTKTNCPTPRGVNRSAAALVVICCLVMVATAAQQFWFGEGSSNTLAERVRMANAAEYRRVLDEFDVYLARYPDDEIAAVERCKFIDEFLYVEDGSIDTVFEDSEKCEEGLRTGSHTQSGAVKLYLWLQGEGSTLDGEGLLAESAFWTTLQQAELHEGLSGHYELSDTLRAGEHATKAVWLNPDSGSRMRAAEHYMKIGAKASAVSLIEQMPSGKWTPWSLDNAVVMLLNMGNTAAARKLIEANEEIDLPAASRIRLAASMLEAGDEKAGRAIAEPLLTSRPEPDAFGAPRLDQQVFEFQLRYGTAVEAERAYRALRDRGFEADAFARHRLALTMTYWNAPWQLSDLIGVLALASVFVAVCLLPLVVILPVHYRSVVKRLQGFVVAPSGPGSPWSLRGAWYALAVCLAAGEAAVYVFSYPDFEAGFGTWFSLPFTFNPPSDDRGLGRAMLWGTVLLGVLLLPLLRHSGVRTVLLGKWSMRRSVLSGTGWALLLLFIAGILDVLFSGSSQAGIGLGTETVRAMQGIYSLYGILTLFSCVAILTPIVEEVIFRGVLLRSFARHLSFWGSAVIQSAIFVMMHEDTSDFPFLFLFAMAASWLASRSGGILAPIVMHLVNNSLAVAALLHSMESLNSTL